MARAWQPMSEEEFARRHQEAVRRGREILAHEPQVVSVAYEPGNGRFVAELNNGCVFIFPADKVQGLRGAAPELLAQVKPSPSRLGLHWDGLDVHFSLAGLMSGVFGSPQWVAELTQTNPKVSRKPQKQRNAA